MKKERENLTLEELAKKRKVLRNILLAGKLLDNRKAINEEIDSIEMTMNKIYNKIKEKRRNG